MQSNRQIRRARWSAARRRILAISARVSLPALALLAITSCGGGSAPPPPATHFAVTPSSQAVPPGVGFTVTVAALDSAGNVATSYAGSVRFTSSDGAAVLPTPAPLAQGEQTFSVTLATSGLQSVSATDTATPSLTGQSPSIAVSGPATHVLLTVPVAALARATVPVTVTALDADNNPALGDDGSVLITSSDAAALLPAAAVPLSSGSGSFIATLESIGAQTFTATDTVQASIAGTSAPIEVSAAPPIAITSGAPPGGTVGSSYSPRRGVCHGHHCTTAYNFPLLASGGVGTFSWDWSAAPRSSLPPGLSLAGNLISGTPPVGSVGSYGIIIMATDGGTPAAQASFPYTISIVNPPPPAIAAQPGPPGATLNQPYSFQFQISGFAPLSVSETGALPPGLAPLTATGLLAGTPSAANLYPITVDAKDAAGQDTTQAFTIGVFQHGFSPTGSMQGMRMWHTATLLASGDVLVTGGETASVTTAASELYTPTNGSFALTGALQVARAQHTATLLCDLAALPCSNPKVLIAGGWNAASLAGSAELYDPAAGTFTLTAGSLATARAGHTATRLKSGKVLIVGGSDGVTALASAELFDPATGTFAATAAPLASARSQHTATLLADGRVLIAGGLDANSVPLGSAELYDPAARTFSTIPSPLTSARMGHTATLLPGGTVLIAGGVDANNAAVAAAEIYDPAAAAPAASFTPTGALVTSRSSHTAVLLPSGQVLIVGGYSNVEILVGCCDQGQYLPHAELYDPASGLFASTGAMQSARANHTLTLLGGSGHVLVVGGLALYNTLEVLRTAEVYQ